MALLILYLLLAIGVSFLCSVLEAIILSVTPAYVAELEHRRPRVGMRLRRQKEDIDRPLSAILSLNTVAHTVGAAGVGAQAQIVFGEAYVTITSIILTLLILVVSEIIPKTIGATYWRALAPWATLFLRVLIPLLYPLVVLAQGITVILSRNRKPQLFHRHEFSAYAELGVEEGAIREQQSRIVKNLVRLDSLRGRDIMTPRTVVVAYPDTLTINDVINDPQASSVARFPLLGPSMDEITGYVLRDDLLEQYAEGRGNLPLSRMRRRALVLPDLVHLGDLFEKLLGQQEQMAVLVNEYGGFSGVATVEDIVETLVGMDIVDEDDTVANRRAMARRWWEQRAKRLGIYENQEEGEEGAEGEAGEENPQEGVQGDAENKPNTSRRADADDRKRRSAERDRPDTEADASGD
jgi:CBS domain containing-hemolysin-like protein